MFGRKLISFAALIMAVSLWGCTSNFDDTTNPPSSGINPDASYLGAANCAGCHLDSSWSAISATSLVNVTNYLASTHASRTYTNEEINAEAGECLNCHDPLGDGPSLEHFIDAANIPLEGLASVGCENCHGAGGDHASGVTPVPDVTPDYQRCGQCHNANTSPDHDEYHPEATSIVEKVSASPHINGIQQVKAPCAKCHSDEGARTYKNTSGTPTELKTLIPGSTPDLDEASPIQCRTCHNAHSLNLLLATDENQTGSAEYNTCTSCHQVSEAYHGETGPDGLSLDRVFYDTHFDTPGTLKLVGGRTNYQIIEGYNLGPIDANGNFGVASERVCRDCHDVHAADTTINRQWANSGHAGHIAQVKADAVMAGSANDALIAAVDDAGEPWAHYDWDHTYEADGDADGISDSDRGECQRCHTATGAKNYLEAMKTVNDTDPTNDITYDPVNNDFSHLSGWQFVDPSTGLETTPSTNNELLYCWGCHANNSGALRNPGPVISEYTEGDTATTVVYPDSAASNVCITCHAGRKTGKSIAVDTPDFTAGSFVNSHYLPAAGILFAESGYHYSGRDYSNSAVDTTVGPHEHTTLGMGTTGVPAIDNAYATGPCVTCHFSSNDGSHTLSPFTQYSATNLALNSVCVNCHEKRGETYNGVETEAANIWLGQPDSDGNYAAGTYNARYQASIEALEIMLSTAGQPYLGRYPYFNNPSDWTVISTAVGAVSGEDTMGAAFNFNLLHHEPGGVSHNRQYTRRLLYDSIDFLDDGILNYSVLTTLNGLTITTDFTTDDQADAIKYLIDDDLAIGTAAERY